MRTVRGAAVSLDELETLYRERGLAFERFAVAVVGDEQLGCDAVHDAFVLAVRNRRRFRADGPLEAWVWRIVLNEARKRRSEHARLVPTDPTSLVERASRNGDAGEARASALIAGLPQRQRLALFLRYYADLDYAAIASVLQIAPGTVAATLNAAHSTLRKRLQEAPQ